MATQSCYRKVTKSFLDCKYQGPRPQYCPCIPEQYLLSVYLLTMGLISNTSPVGSHVSGRLLNGRNLRLQINYFSNTAQDLLQGLCERADVLQLCKQRDSVSPVDAETCSRTRAQECEVGSHLPLQLLPLVPYHFGCGRQQSAEFSGCKSMGKIVQFCFQCRNP